MLQRSCIPARTYSGSTAISRSNRTHLNRPTIDTKTKVCWKRREQECDNDQERTRTVRGDAERAAGGARDPRGAAGPRGAERGDREHAAWKLPVRDPQDAAQDRGARGQEGGPAAAPGPAGVRPRPPPPAG